MKTTDEQHGEISGPRANHGGRAARAVDMRFKPVFNYFLTAVEKGDAEPQLKLEGRWFMTEIRKEVKDCDFGDLKEDLMLHVLIRGINSEKMLRRLFGEGSKNVLYNRGHSS